jgi:hypothetical protein
MMQDSMRRLVTGQGKPPMTLEETVQVSELTFAVRDQIREGGSGDPGQEGAGAGTA